MNRVGFARTLAGPATDEQTPWSNTADTRSLLKDAPDQAPPEAVESETT